MEGITLLACEVPGELHWPVAVQGTGRMDTVQGLGQRQGRNLQAALMRLPRHTCTSFSLLETGI